LSLTPDALAMAKHADDLRKHGQVLGPLHGIPVLLKDNIGSGDQMQTSAGSFALVGTPAQEDSTIAANLRAGGAVILGKTNLSEWANFRSFESISGWSGRGGQTNNPYGLNRNPCGSSSGSGAAASANFAVSFGSENMAASSALETPTGSLQLSRRSASLAAPVSCQFRIRRIRLALTGAPWLIAPPLWALFRAALSMDAIKLPVAFPLGGEVSARVPLTFLRTTRSS